MSASGDFNANDETPQAVDANTRGALSCDHQEGHPLQTALALRLALPDALADDRNFYGEGQTMSDASDQVRAKRLRDKLHERRQWAEYQRTYERCKAIAVATWKDDLEKAAAQQQTLAEQMQGHMHICDPAFDRVQPRPIMVPLFTPRDRLQFLKEVAVALLIGTERRGLTVTPEVKDVEAQEAPAGAVPVEAASGADEAVEDASQYGERVSQASAPSV